MSNDDLYLMAHLMRRAGFGATREELDHLVARGYENVVEDLLAPEDSNDIDEDLLFRYHKMAWRAGWIYRFVNTGTPLNEKMTLFWHQLLAVGISKSNNHDPLHVQIAGFRRNALSDLRSVLVDVSSDPAMIYWLDNQENLKDAPNENYGRELLELFSMGVGNYTEEDVKASTQAFTGWSFTSIIPSTTIPARFAYDEDAHDNSNKVFLGESGAFNGEDIVEIVVKQPATARFLSRLLYNYFVADETPVATWNEVPPQDPDAIDVLSEVYLESEGRIRPILRALFNADFFKESQFKRVKSPVELVTGLLKLQGTFKIPKPGMNRYDGAAQSMGQTLINPLSVEGWHTGPEWIDGGTLNERVNYAVAEVSDPALPGIRGIIDCLAQDAPLTPVQLVDRCLDLLGPVRVGGESRDSLISHAATGGTLDFDNGVDCKDVETRVIKMLQLIVSTREYQFG